MSPWSARIGGVTVSTQLLERRRSSIPEGFPPLFVVIYARASVDKRGRAISVESQVKAGKQWCADNGATVVAILHDNNMSASRYATAERPEYAEALRLLATGEANALWTWENSRAQRELDVFVRLRRILIDRHGYWIYDDHVWDMNDPDDQISTAEDALEAEKESARLRKRVLRGRNHRALELWWHGPKTWGLRKIWDQRTGECIALEKDEEEAPAAAELCRRLLARESASVIANDFNARGILPPHALQWRTRHVMRVHELSMDPVAWESFTRSLLADQLDSACRVVTMMASRENPKNIVRVLNRSGAAHVFPGVWNGEKVKSAALRNPTLAGLKLHHGEIIGEGRWPKIIEPEEYYELVAMYGRPDRGKVKDGERIRHLLTGILLCGRCDGRCRVARRLPSKKKRTERTKRSQPTYECKSGHRKRAQAVTDAFVTEALLSRLERPDAAELFRVQVSADPLKDALKRAKELRARLDTFIDQATAGRLSAESLAKIEKKLQPQIEAAEREITDRSTSSVVGQVVGPNARQVWAQLRLEQKRAVLRATLRARLLPARRGRAGFDPASVEITWLTAPAPVPAALLADTPTDVTTKGEQKAAFLVPV